MDNREVFIKGLSLQGIEIKTIKKISTGANSSTYIIGDNQNKWILKCYPLEIHSNRNRLLNELKFLKFLQDNELQSVPIPVAWDEEKNWMLMNYIKGESVNSATQSSCQALIEFILRLQSLKDKPNSILIGMGSEAFLSINNHFSSLENKINFIHQKLIRKSINTRTCKLLEYNLQNLQILKLKYKDINSDEDLDKEIKLNDLILSQSDVGCHNMIKANNKYYFIDFEYAGWDDPCKLISDLILQPDHGIPLRYMNIIKQLFDNRFISFDPSTRLPLMLELCRINWISIIIKSLLREPCPYSCDYIQNKVESYSIESRSIIIDFNYYFGFNNSFSN
tara:strand:+ start:4390 stop:5397 length:1008 start_codon:yes stop_codon:yes gene_type:complete